MTLNITPKFSNPPLKETFCSVSFQDISDMHAPQLGAFWEKIREDYPITETHVPLPPISMHQDTQFTLQLQFMPPQLPRTWFIHKNKSSIIQIQRDRLIFNWRQLPSLMKYPSFEILSAEFISIFNKFNAFCLSDLGNKVELNGLELGYVNTIPLNNCEMSTSTFSDIFPNIFNVGKKSLLQKMGRINCNMQFNLPDNNGNLHISLNSMQQQEDGTQAIRLDLSSKWISPMIVETDLKDWFDKAHEFTVASFVDITSEENHKNWGRTQ